METVLLEPEFEGMYLPKILGYSVLRGEVDKQYKYTRPQRPLQSGAAGTICHSSNFDILRKKDSPVYPNGLRHEQRHMGDQPDQQH